MALTANDVVDVGGTTTAPTGTIRLPNDTDIRWRKETLRGFLKQ